MIIPIKFRNYRGVLSACLLSTAVLLACGQGAEVGENCETSSSVDECVDNAICTNESGDALVCRQSCEAKEDCPSGHNCNGISSTTLKSCQPE
jgi:hypothetical protein